jgi:hypothetical protein
MIAPNECHKSGGRVCVLIDWVGHRLINQKLWRRADRNFCENCQLEWRQKRGLKPEIMRTWREQMSNYKTETTGFKLLKL